MAGRSTSVVLFSLMLLSGLLAGCSGDDPVTPPDEGSDDALLLSRISVAMVTGRSETVNILEDGTPIGKSGYTVASSDPAVASVTSTESTLTVTGVGVGRCTIRVDGDGGRSCVLPVQVYDPQVIDTGELLVTYTDRFVNRGYWAAGPGRYLWDPLPPAGFHAVGSVLGPFDVDINGRQAAMVVQAKPGSDAVAFTHEFELVLNYSAREFWRPIPPEGYKALGMMATYQSVPDSVACIREDLTMTATATAEPIYTFFAYDTHWSWWGIEQPDAGPHAGAYLAPGTYLYHPGETPPTMNPTMNVLKVELPLLAEAPAREFAPKLTGYASPPTETVPRFARALLVPCTAVRDAAYDDDMPWRIAHSPFYRLERQVYYKLLYHNYNQTSEVQTNQVTIRSGVTTSASQSFHQDTGVSIAVETGVDIKFFSSKITTTISLEMGYESQTSVSELEEKEVSTSINTAPGKAAALWQEYNRYVLYRHDGTELQPVSAWEFGIDSYVTDDYPD